MKSFSTSAIAMASKFPKLADGDVLLSLPGGRVYQLHANVLRRQSRDFASLLTEENAAILSAKAKKEGIFVRYRLNLVDAESEHARFILIKVDNRGRSSLTGTSFVIENGRVPHEVYKHYDNLFRAFYNEELDIAFDRLNNVLQDCVGLANVAERHGSMAAVAETIDVSLLRQGQKLFRSIANNPVSWINLAAQIRSRTIFKDALIHLVGEWNMLGAEKLEDLRPDCFEIAQRKEREFYMKKTAIELRIAGWYSESIQIAGSASAPSQSDYAKLAYEWIGLSIFRHWFGQNVLDGKNKDAQDGGFLFYKALSEGGDTYLDREECKQFHQYCPMSARGRTIFLTKLNAYKSSIAKLVDYLVKNNSQIVLDEGYKHDHLLSLQVEITDYPWAVVSSDLANSAIERLT